MCRAVLNQMWGKVAIQKNKRDGTFKTCVAQPRSNWNGGDGAHPSRPAQKSSQYTEDSAVGLSAEDSLQTVGLRSRVAQLRQWGLAGVAAYGVLNTVYYVTALCICWFFVAKVEAGVGLSEALRKLASVFAMTWAASQVTKVPRMLGALALAPVMERMFSVIMRKTGASSQQQAFALLVAGCMAITIFVIGGMILVAA